VFCQQPLYLILIFEGILWCNRNEGDMAVGYLALADALHQSIASGGHGVAMASAMQAPVESRLQRLHMYNWFYLAQVPLSSSGTL
jgi:hypothetical protein